MFGRGQKWYFCFKGDKGRLYWSLGVEPARIFPFLLQSARSIVV